MTTFGLLGAAAQAAETAEYAAGDILAFRAVSHDHLDPTSDTLVDIATADPALLSIPVIAAVGAPGLRRLLIGQWAGSVYHTVIAASSVVSPTAAVGEGTVIAPGAVVATHAVVGRHVLVNVLSSVNHDTVVEDFATISPGVHIGGRCRIGAGTFIGIGASVSHGVSIASGSVIGAGAVVLQSIVEPGVYAGVPARRIRDQEEWLRDL